MTLIMLIESASAHASSFPVRLTLSGEIPHELPLPLPHNGTLVRFNVLTGKPLTGNPKKKLMAVLEEAKDSPSKQGYLKVFRTISTGCLDVSDGTDERDPSYFSLVATYRLFFSETTILITPFFEPLTPHMSYYNNLTPGAYPAPVHPEQWYPVQNYFPNPSTLEPVYYQPFIAPSFFPLHRPVQPFAPQRDSYSIRNLQTKLHALQTKFLNSEKKSSEQVSLLDKEQAERKKLVAEIALLKENLLHQQASATNSSPCPTETPSDPTTSPETQSEPVYAPAPEHIGEASIIPGREKPKLRKKRIQTVTHNSPPAASLKASTKKEESDSQAEPILPCAVAHEKKVEQNSVRKAAQEAEKAKQILIWKKVEIACRDKEFSQAFDTIKLLDQNTPLYIKELLSIVKALHKLSPEESYPEIIEAARTLSQTKNSREEYIINETKDRRILIEFLLKHSSEEERKGLLEEAGKLGNVLAATHWHLLQMEETTKPCNKKNCVHEKALEFFSSHSDNAILRTHVPKYLAMIKAAQCSRQKDGERVIMELMKQAQSSGLSETDIQTIKLQLPDTYKHRARPTPPSTSPTQEAFNACKKAAVDVLQNNALTNLTVAQLTMVSFIEEQKKTGTLETLITCVTEGLADVTNESSLDLQLTTLFSIQSIINTFRNNLPLEHLERLHQLFKKIPMKESKPNHTRTEKCLVQLQLQLSHILNPFFIELAYLQRNFLASTGIIKKQRILRENVTALLHKVQNSSEACRILQSLINYRTNDESGFCDEVEAIIGAFLKQHPEKKSLWGRYLINASLKSLHAEFEKKESIFHKAQLIHTEATQFFEKITTREEAENFIQALCAYYHDTDTFGFFNLIMTVLKDTVSKNEPMQELWKDLLPVKKSTRWCTLL